MTDVNSASLPTINFNELEFLGISDINPLLTKQGWDETGFKKILAAWADRVKAQSTGRTTTGTSVAQGSNPAPAGTLPSDTEIAAVAGWRQPNTSVWTYNALMAAGYSDWAIAGEYAYRLY